MQRVPATKAKGKPVFSLTVTPDETLRRVLTGSWFQCDQRHPCRNCSRRLPQPVCQYEGSP